MRYLTAIRSLGALLLALLAALAGCQGLGPVARLAAPPVEQAALAPRRTPEFGTLRLTIHWPRRDLPGFRAATIPTSTKALVIDTLAGLTRTSRTTIARPDAATSTQATVRVEAGNNLSVVVHAFRVAEPDPDSDLEIARGNTTVNIVRSRTTMASVTLNALFVPSIAAFDSNAGKVGDTIRIQGSNLGVVGTATPAIQFEAAAGNLVSAQVIPRTAGELDFIVPAGAATGKLIIGSDGSQTQSDAVFWVLAGIALDAPRPVTGDTSAATERMARYRSLIDFKATVAWVLGPGRTVADHGTPPAPTWLSTNAVEQDNAIVTSGVPAAGTVLQGGTVADGNPYATVRAASTNTARTDIGAAIATVAAPRLTLIPVGIDSVALDRTAVSLNAAPLVGSTPSPAFAASGSVTLVATVTSTLPFGSGVTWTSSDQTRATVNSSGKVSAVAGAPAGSAEIKATAAEDGTVQATASITVTSKGSLYVGID